MSRLLLLLASGTFFLIATLRAQEAVAPPKELAPPTSAEVVRMLDDIIELPPMGRFQNGVAPVKEHLSLFTDLFAKKNRQFKIIIEQDAFREDAAEAPDILETNVPTWPLSQKLTMRQALNNILHHLPSRNGAILVLRGTIEITTQQAARIDARLDRPIAIDLRDVPLRKAIEEIADHVGVTVMIDPRCGPEMDKAVSVLARNDVSARGILSNWAQFYELRLITDPHRAVLIPEAQYINELKARVDESKLRKELEKNIGEPAPENRLNVRFSRHIRMMDM